MSSRLSEPKKFMKTGVLCNMARLCVRAMGHPLITRQSPPCNSHPPAFPTPQWMKLCPIHRTFFVRWVGVRRTPRRSLVLLKLGLCFFLGLDFRGCAKLPSKPALVTGHDFSRAANALKSTWASAQCHLLSQKIRKMWRLKG